MSAAKTAAAIVRERIALTMLLGAITTVILAWLPAALPIHRWSGADSGYRSYFVPPRILLGEAVLFHRSDRPLDTHLYGSLTSTWLTGTINTSLGATIERNQITILDSAPFDPELTGNLPPGAGFYETRAGWPWRGLASRSFPTPVTLRTGGVLQGDLGVIDCGAAPSWMRQKKRLQLPIMPLWPGLIGNLIVWSGFWLVILGLLGLARGVWRQRNGRCPKCSYSLTEGREPGCPECGLGRQVGPTAALQ
jgi:hypothetical protein